jgi:hypothetical protein
MQPVLVVNDEEVVEEINQLDDPAVAAGVFLCLRPLRLLPALSSRPTAMSIRADGGRHRSDFTAPATFRCWLVGRSVVVVVVVRFVIVILLLPCYSPPLLEAMRICPVLGRVSALPKSHCAPPYYPLDNILVLHASEAKECPSEQF